MSKCVEGLLSEGGFRVEIIVVVDPAVLTNTAMLIGLSHDVYIGANITLGVTTQ